MRADPGGPIRPMHSPVRFCSPSRNNVVSGNELLIIRGVSMNERTREQQYQYMVDRRGREGLASLGIMSGQVWHDDPKRLTFLLARYKFVAKMLAGSEKVLEVGCADAFGTRIVQQAVGSVTAVDFDPIFVEDVKARMTEKWRFECQVHDMLKGPMPAPFDAAYAVDVLEHILPEDEATFVANIAESLSSRGVLIVGSPSIQSQAYASPVSKEGHVNCKDEPGMRNLMNNYINNVFMFSMNDEVVHTGFYPLAHYLFAVCCSKKA